MQRKEKKKKKKHRDDDDNDGDDDETYHPSQNYNDDSQVDPEFRPTKRELREADKEGRLISKGSGKSCSYVNMLISVHMLSFFMKIPRKCILYPRALCLIIYS